MEVQNKVYYNILLNIGLRNKVRKSIFKNCIESDENLHIYKM